jgi:uncharacterized protein YxjI
VTVADPGTVLGELQSSDRLLVQQVFKPIANEYRISIPSPGSGEEGRPLLYVKQKKMKIKEDIRFRVSPDDEAHLFMIKSKSVFEFRGRHEVLDVDGAVIGLLVKDFTRSLLRSHWHVRDSSGSELLEAYEASWIIALARRFADLGPDWFSLLTWLPFNFVLRRGEQEMGTYKRVLGKFRDRYVLELASEMRDADRRLIVTFAVSSTRSRPLAPGWSSGFVLPPEQPTTTARGSFFGSDQRTSLGDPLGRGTTQSSLVRPLSPRRPGSARGKRPLDDRACARAVPDMNHPNRTEKSA